MLENEEDIINGLTDDVSAHGLDICNSDFDNISNEEEMQTSVMMSNYWQRDVGTRMQVLTDLLEKEGGIIDGLIDDVGAHGVENTNQEDEGRHVARENDTGHYEHVEQCDKPTRNPIGGNNAGNTDGNRECGGTIRKVPVFDGVEITQPVDLRE